jgi:hypothetical protein
MDFLKQHYEKIALSLVLLIVLFLAIKLRGRISDSQKELEAKRVGIIRQEPKLVPALDLTRHAASTRRLGSPATNKLDGPHNLFNPVKWVQLQDGTVRKVADGDVLVRDFTVTAIRPLKVKATYDGTVGVGETVRYKITLTDESPVRVQDQKGKTRVSGPPAKPGGRPEKNDLFTMVEMKGPPEDPTEFTVELVKGKQLVTFGKGKPFEQVVAFEADAKYDPESKKFPGLRQDSKAPFAGDIYKVIAITTNQVTIEAEQTQKRTTVDLAPAP